MEYNQYKLYYNGWTLKIYLDGFNSTFHFRANSCLNHGVGTGGSEENERRRRGSLEGGVERGWRRRRWRSKGTSLIRTTMPPMNVRMKKLSWIYLNLLEFTWIYLNLLKFAFFKKCVTDRPTDQQLDKASYRAAFFH